jgi:hypothetical protein
VLFAFLNLASDENGIRPNYSITAMWIAAFKTLTKSEEKPILFLGAFIPMLHSLPKPDENDFSSHELSILGNGSSLPPPHLYCLYIRRSLQTLRLSRHLAGTCYPGT